jgi:hypothetical protein
MALAELLADRWAICTLSEIISLQDNGHKQPSSGHCHFDAMEFSL